MKKEEKEMPQWEIDYRAKLKKTIAHGRTYYIQGVGLLGSQAKIEFEVELKRLVIESKNTRR